LISALARDVTLVWDPNPPQDLVRGYLVYEHVDGAYKRRTAVATNRAVLPDVAPGPHCYVVTATNDWGESDLSNEACTEIQIDVPLDDPVPRPVPDLTLDVGDLVVLTNWMDNVADPTRPFLYDFCGANPIQASVNPTNGVFMWRADARYASTTNSVSVCITDPVSGQIYVNQFKIMVHDYVEIWPEPGVFRNQESASSGLRVRATAPIQDIQFAMEAPPDRMTNVIFRGFPQTTCLSAFQQVAPGKWMVRWEGCGPSLPEGEFPLAQFVFKVNGGRSAFLPVRLSEITAHRSDGTEFPKTKGLSGRLTVIGTEPLLEISTLGNRAGLLMLYGKPGALYVIEANGNGGDPWAWEPLWMTTLVNPVQTFDASNLGWFNLLFRAREVPPVVP
jgi:hypothetical protein